MSFAEFSNFHINYNNLMIFVLCILYHKLKLNPWCYSSEEPRPTEAVAARWQYMGLVVSKALVLQP